MTVTSRASRRLWWTLLVALSAASASSAASVAAAQEGVRITPPYLPPTPLVAFSRAAIALRDSLVSRARAQLGRRYRHGGESPTRGFDCSGLVSFVLASLNLSVPRTAAQQARTGSEVTRDTAQLLPGDLVTFGRGERVTHIGIYVGEGRFVHASSRAGRVVESRLLRAPAPGIRPWRGVRRLVEADSGAYSQQSTVNGQQKSASE